MTNVIMTKTKTCTRCKLCTMTSNFHKAKRESDGLSDWCRACFSENYKKNREKKLKQAKEWRENNPEIVQANARKAYLRNPKKYKRKAMAWVKANPERRSEITKNYEDRHRDLLTARRVQYHLDHGDKVRSKVKEWQKNHPEKRRADSRERDALKRRLKWSSLFQKEIDAIYAKASKKGLVVDHIIPMKNKNVSGLHLPWNLQILPNEINSKKSNKFDGTYENRSWQK